MCPQFWHFAALHPGPGYVGGMYRRRPPLALSPATTFTRHGQWHGHQPGQHSQPAQCHQPPTSAGDASSSCGIVISMLHVLGGSTKQKLPYVPSFLAVVLLILNNLHCLSPHQLTLLQQNSSPYSYLPSYYSCARGTSLHNLTSPSYLSYDRDAVKLSTA